MMATMAPRIHSTCNSSSTEVREPHQGQDTSINEQARTPSMVRTSIATMALIATEVTDNRGMEMTTTRLDMEHKWLRNGPSDKARSETEEDTSKHTLHILRTTRH